MHLPNSREGFICRPGPDPPTHPHTLVTASPPAQLRSRPVGRQPCFAFESTALTDVALFPRLRRPFPAAFGGHAATRHCCLVFQPCLPLRLTSCGWHWTPPRVLACCAISTCL
jgi:hypothetical protein